MHMRSLALRALATSIEALTLATRARISTLLLTLTGRLFYDLQEWRDRDSVAAGERVYSECQSFGIPAVSYDNIGVGAGCKGKFRDIEADLLAAGRHSEMIKFTEFTASENPCNPDDEYQPDRTNAQHFLNIKASRLVVSSGSIPQHL